MSTKLKAAAIHFLAAVACAAAVEACAWLITVLSGNALNIPPAYALYVPFAAGALKALEGYFTTEEQKQADVPVSATSVATTGSIATVLSGTVAGNQGFPPAATAPVGGPQPPVAPPTAGSA